MYARAKAYGMIKNHIDSGMISDRNALEIQEVHETVTQSIFRHKARRRCDQYHRLDEPDVEQTAPRAELP